MNTPRMCPSAAVQNLVKLERQRVAEWDKEQTMSTITLQPDLVEDLERLAAQQHIVLEEIIATALRRYMRQVQDQKIQKEAEAFRAMHAGLVKQYLGQVVAVHEGQVVDHDEDFVVLHRRIRQRFGRTAVLLRRVGPEPERVLTFLRSSWGATCSTDCASCSTARLP